MSEINGFEINVRYHGEIVIQSMTLGNSNIDDSKFSISRINTIPLQITITITSLNDLVKSTIDRISFRYLEFSYSNSVLKIVHHRSLFFAYDSIRKTQPFTSRHGKERLNTFVGSECVGRRKTKTTSDRRVEKTTKF